MKLLASLICTLLFWGIGYSQDPNSVPLKALDSLIAAHELPQAKQLLDKQVSDLYSQGDFYNATSYIYYLGRIISKMKDKEQGETAVLDFGKTMESKTTDPKALRQLHLEIASFYEYLGNPKKSIEHDLIALDYTQKMPDKTGELLGLVYSNLGVYSSYTGDYQQAASYQKKALEAYDSYEKTDKSNYYMVYNSLGATMWYASKIDSALVYYQLAEKSLEELEPTPKNKYYRPAILNNNMAIIFSIQGDANGALNAMKKTVTLLNQYQKEDISQSNKDSGRQFLFQAIDNYAGMYKDMGDFQKSKELLLYAYEQKKKYLGSDSPEVLKSKSLIGQINVSLKEFGQAKKFLDEAIAGFEADQGNFTYWLADAYRYKATLYEEANDIAAAKICYDKSSALYKQTLGEYYDEIYLDFVVFASSFYAKHGYEDQALSMAKEAHDYIVENQGGKTLLEYYQTLNLAEIEYELGNYPEAVKQSELALDLLNDSVFKRDNGLGKIQVEAQKPMAINIKTKSEYLLQKDRDTVFLKNKLQELNQAINFIENNKTIITDDSAVSVLIADNTSLFEFTKKLALELYSKTHNTTYLNNVLTLHESMLYYKIRSRLNSQTSINYGNIPESIIKEEKDLKAALNAPLDDTTDMESFMKTQNDWNEFLEKLKTNYPNYFNLKYASLAQSLSTIQSGIPKDKTFVRYAFIDGTLVAFVISQERSKLFTLEGEKVKDLILKLNDNQEQLTTDFWTLHELYNYLWKPFENDIKTENVVIIPDQVLFNLSFEMLTPQLVKSMPELATNSLLSKHCISYNYSLFLINQKSKPIGADRNFVAFAPEFTKNMKDEYVIALKDSIALDKTYLNLLPQPFSVQVAKHYSRYFNGNFFVNENASKSVFLNNANEHKIIHIGTHAESNNLSPELSRLIFAKSTNDEDNSLYTYEIYNQNLNANLAILTACETGKPTYQSGEGMISLAHAFNYAGSESILTSLWKIDEQSSATILTSFYDYLAQGLSKDKALQLAKLDYLSQAKGRTLEPQYWAGMILMGNTAPIDMQTAQTPWLWILGFLVFAVLVGYIVIKRKRAI